jgi:hypothetical protein
MFDRPQDQSVPERKPVKPVEFDSGEDVRNLGDCKAEFARQMSSFSSPAILLTQLLFLSRLCG